MKLIARFVLAKVDIACGVILITGTRTKGQCC